jgi:hypothetical protein
MGPVQVLVVGFERPVFSGEVLAEFARLRKAGIVRLVDLLLVSRALDGTLETIEAPTEVGTELGWLAAALLGRPADEAGDQPETAVTQPETAAAPPDAAGQPGGAGGQSDGAGSQADGAGSQADGAGSQADGAGAEGAAWSLADAVPAGSAAAVALIEHIWAGPLTAAVRRAGGSALEETWLAPADVAELESLIARRG